MSNTPIPQLLFHVNKTRFSGTIVISFESARSWSVRGDVRLNGKAYKITGYLSNYQYANGEWSKVDIKDLRVNYGDSPLTQNALSTLYQYLRGVRDHIQRERQDVLDRADYAYELAEIRSLEVKAEKLRKEADELRAQALSRSVAVVKPEDLVPGDYVSTNEKLTWHPATP